MFGMFLAGLQALPQQFKIHSIGPQSPAVPHLAFFADSESMGVFTTKAEVANFTWLLARSSPKGEATNTDCARLGFVVTIDANDKVTG